MTHKQKTGFTLTEFLITLAIAGLFITLAVPGYYSLIQNNKVVTMVNKLSAGLHFARIEAIRRGVRVSLCAAADSTLTSCGNQWAQGWIVFLDADNNNAVDATTNLIKVNEALPSGTNVTASSNMISYDGTGFVSTGAFTMTINASGCTGNNSRVVTVSTSGRISIVKANCP